jgi:hypothetical protein
MKFSVLPSGDILLQIGHLGEGYEILMTRWLNETNICNHEAYYEDMSIHANLYSNWMDLSFDAVCQYSLRAVKANESSTNEPAWVWQPLLIDYVPQWKTPGGTHPSKFDKWANYTYPSQNAGDPSFGGQVYYDSGVAYFNLTDYQKFIIEIPKGSDNPGYYAETMPTDAIRRIIRAPSSYPAGDGSKWNFTAYGPIMCNGTMSLGWYGNWTGAPYLDSPAIYDVVNNTLTMQGPMNFENTHWPNGALYWGAPWIEFNVTPVTGGLSVPGPHLNPSDAPASGPISVTSELLSMCAIAFAVAVAIVAVLAGVGRKT